jgi:hypothetical protein
VQLRQEIVDAIFRDPDLLRKSFHLGRFHESRGVDGRRSLAGRGRRNGLRLRDGPSRSASSWLGLRLVLHGLLRPARSCADSKQKTVAKEVCI